MIDKAIAYFEEAIHESNEIIADCSPKLQAELEEQKEYFRVALKALEKQEPVKVIPVKDQPIWKRLSKCPICQTAVCQTAVYDGNYYNYCATCGQALER